MSKAKRALQSVLFGALAVVAGGSAIAEHAEALLGSQGEVYRVMAAHDPAGDPYLVLTIQHPGGAVEAAIVPETAGSGRETSPYLIYDHGSRTVFLTWEERVNYIHSLIRLAGFQDGEWTEVIEVSDGAFGFKGEPRLAATQDAFEVGLADGGTRSITRTVLHVVWVEERGEGQLVAYAPVTLLDGHYVGQRQIFDLSALVASEVPVPTDLWTAVPPSVAAGSDDHSVVVGLVSPQNGQLASVRISMLPGELSLIADELRSHLIDVGVHHDWQTPGGLERLGDTLRSHLIDVGHRLDPAILRHVADGLRSHLIDVGVQYGPQELRRMAKDLRSHLIDVGFRLDESGLRRAAATVASAVIEVAATSEESDDVASMTQVARVSVVGDWTRPAEAHGDSALLVSRSGQAALLWWMDGRAVLYRETFGEEWSPVVRLPLGETLDAEQAMSLLQNRIRNR